MRDAELPPEAEKYAHIFRKSLPMRIQLHEILRDLGSARDQMCLDIGAENGVFCHHLRQWGGRWQSAAATDGEAERLETVLGGKVYVFQEGALPFKNKMFDAVVAIGFLERVRDDEAVIEECHRVLKTDGRLIVNVTRLRRWSLIGLLRRAMGLTYEKRGHVRPGYTESQLFEILKNGFDVYTVRSYSRFFVELVETFVQFFVGRMSYSETYNEVKIRHVYSIASVFYWIANQLDLLLFFSRGSQMIALAKRRAWRPRKAPVLVDGRPISEAVLSKAPR